MQQGPTSDIDSLADMLVQRLSLSSPDPLVLVLDDLHFVADPGIHALLGRLVQFAPRQLHLVLISHVDPPLPLSRWRAGGVLNELRSHDLSFDLAETLTFLSNSLDQAPDASLAQVLHQRTEGWAVGLRLALLALKGDTDHAEFAAQFRATNTRYVADYLVDEVLKHQPPSIQEFLISTSILNRFSATLGAAVLDIDENEARLQIEHLERENLFLVGLNALPLLGSLPAPLWYRYHHQFQDMLRSRLHMRYGRETDRGVKPSGHGLAVGPRFGRRCPPPPDHDFRLRCGSRLDRTPSKHHVEPASLPGSGGMATSTSNPRFE